MSFIPIFFPPEFDKIASDVRGKCGLELWEEIARHIKDEENRSTIFTRASDHSNTTIAKGMRIKHLQQIASEKGKSGKVL